MCSRFKHKLCIVLCGSQRSSCCSGRPGSFDRRPCRKRWRVTGTLAKVRSWLPSQSSTRFVESKPTLARWSKFTLADRLKSIFHSRSMSILPRRSGSTCLRFTWVSVIGRQTCLMAPLAGCAQRDFWTVAAHLYKNSVNINGTIIFVCTLGHLWRLVYFCECDENKKRITRSIFGLWFCFAVMTRYQSTRSRSSHEDCGPSVGRLTLRPPDQSVTLRDSELAEAVAQCVVHDTASQCAVAHWAPSHVQG